MLKLFANLTVYLFLCYNLYRLLVRQHTPKRMLHDEEHAAFPFYILSTFIYSILTNVATGYKTLLYFLRIAQI